MLKNRLFVLVIVVMTLSINYCLSFTFYNLSRRRRRNNTIRRCTSSRQQQQLSKSSLSSVWQEIWVEIPYNVQNNIVSTRSSDQQQQQQQQQYYWKFKILDQCKINATTTTTQQQRQHGRQMSLTV